MFNAYIVFVNYNNPYVHQVPDKRRGENQKITKQVI